MLILHSQSKPLLWQNEKVDLFQMILKLKYLVCYKLKIFALRRQAHLWFGKTFHGILKGLFSSNLNIKYFPKLYFPNLMGISIAAIQRPLAFSINVM